MSNKTLLKAAFCVVIAGAALYFLSSRPYVQASEIPNSGLSGVSKVTKSSVPSPAINVSPPAVGFEDQTVGTTSSPIVVSVQNTGDAVLNIGSYALNGSNVEDFSVQNFPNNVNVPVGSSTSFSVLFTPSAIGSRSANIVFPTNAPGNLTVTIPLAGDGVTATPTPTPTVTPTPYPGGETAFTYQGKLYESSIPVTTPRDFKFKLFNDADGTQVGTDILVPNVPVNNGVFTVTLDFGEAAFSGASRSLEIAASLPGVNGFTTLNPRQAVTAVPYAIRALNSLRADTASSADTAVSADTALNAVQLGGLAADQYVVTTDARMTDSRDPNPGSANYIQNQNAAPQTASSFSIDGTGRAANFSATTAFQIGGTPALEFGNGLWGLHVGGGSPNSTGDDLTFVGRFAGFENTTGSANSFFGFNTGRKNSTGMSNTFVGSEAGSFNTTGNWNSFVGYSAGLANTTGLGNNFFGSETGKSNTIGNRNNFFGGSAGIGNTIGNDNTFVGEQAGSAQIAGSNNTLLGSNANVGSPNLTYATAVGSGAVVNANNSIVLGRSADSVRVPGGLYVQNLGSGTSTAVCWNSSTFQLSFCSSSMRYKSDIAAFSGGLEMVRELRPVTFTWRNSGGQDLGFIAEDVADIEPRLAVKNSNGEIEGVNYGQISTVLVNAIKEQQAQIEAQDRKIKQLTDLVCSAMPTAGICKAQEEKK